MLLSLIGSAVRQFTLWTAAQRELEGIDVRLWFLDVKDRDIAWKKLGAGLGLLARYSPRTLHRLESLVSVVLVEESYGRFHGAWHRDGRLITLDLSYVLAPTTAPAHIAATLVHEVTHSWLEALGFEYRLERRPRIEAVCFRAMAAFARRLPSADELAAYYEQRAEWALSVGVEGWDNHAFRQRDIGALRNVEADMRKNGASEVVIRALRRLTGTDSA